LTPNLNLRPHVQVPPEGRKLLVLGTTSQGGLMQEMELASAFNVVLTVPMLEEAQIAAVMASLGAFAPQDVRPLLTCAALLSRSTLLLLLRHVSPSYQLWLAC